MDYYINTIGDMQNEKDFFNHCKKFFNNHDFVKFLWKIDDALLEYKYIYISMYIKYNYMYMCESVCLEWIILY